jgi:hypothetical protein
MIDRKTIERKPELLTCCRALPVLWPLVERKRQLWSEKRAPSY